MNLKERIIVVADRIQDVGLDHPPGTTQGDLDRVAAHKQKVLDTVREYLEQEDEEWGRWVDAGKPDLISFCLATGSDPSPTVLRIISRQRSQEAGRGDT